MSHMYFGKLPPEHVALYHFDGKTRVTCEPDGTTGSPRMTVFPTIAEAEAYARSYVASNPGRGCRIYERTGNCAGEFRGAAVPERKYTKAQAKRDLYIGVAAFFMIPLGFAFDKWVGWGFFLGMALGTKFVMLGLMKLTDGIAGLWESKTSRGS